MPDADRTEQFARRRIQDDEAAAGRRTRHDEFLAVRAQCQTGRLGRHGDPPQNLAAGQRHPGHLAGVGAGHEERLAVLGHGHRTRSLVLPRLRGVVGRRRAEHGQCENQQAGRPQRLEEASSCRFTRVIHQRHAARLGVVCLLRRSIRSFCCGKDPVGWDESAGCWWDFANRPKPPPKSHQRPRFARPPYTSATETP